LHHSEYYAIDAAGIPPLEELRVGISEEMVEAVGVELVAAV
jgi:hypothetical protein